MRQVRLAVVGWGGDLLEHAGERVGRDARQRQTEASRRRRGFPRRRLRRVGALGHQRVDSLDEVAEFGVQPIARLRERNRDLGGDAAGIGRQHENPVGHQHRLLDVVGDHQDRLDRNAPLLPQVEQIGAQGFGGKHVERRERLVHQEDLRLHDQRPCEADALAHAARQFLRIGRFEAVQPDSVDRLQRPLARLVRGHAVGPEPEFDVIEDVEPREEGEALKHHRDILGRTKNRLAGNRHRPLRRPGEPGDDAQQRGLAGTRPAEQGDDLAGLHAQRNLAQDRRAGLARPGLEDLGHVVDAQKRRDCWVQHGELLGGR